MTSKSKPIVAAIPIGPESAEQPPVHVQSSPWLVRVSRSLADPSELATALIVDVVGRTSDPAELFPDVTELDVVPLSVKAPKLKLENETDVADAGRVKRPRNTIPDAIVKSL